MKKTLLFAAIILALLISCNQKYKDEPKIIFAPKSSTEELLKQEMENSLENIKNSEGVYENHLLIINKENVIKSLKIDEQIKIPKTKFELVLYSYSIGGDIIRLSEYVIKENGKYYVINKYFSSYDDDPFKNGLGEESKKILEKEEKWKESNESIWWK